MSPRLIKIIVATLAVLALALGGAAWAIAAAGDGSVSLGSDASSK